MNKSIVFIAVIACPSTPSRQPCSRWQRLLVHQLAGTGSQTGKGRLDLLHQPPDSWPSHRGRWPTHQQCNEWSLPCDRQRCQPTQDQQPLPCPFQECKVQVQPSFAGPSTQRCPRHTERVGNWKAPLQPELVQSQPHTLGLMAHQLDRELHQVPGSAAGWFTRRNVLAGFLWEGGAPPPLGDFKVPIFKTIRIIIETYNACK